MKSVLLSIIALAVLFLSATAARAASPPEVSIPVTYSTPGDGFLSLAVHNERGQLVRSLLYALPVKAGKGSISWDGTDDLGRVCRPGDYGVKGIFFNAPPSLKYRMTVGRSGNPPYRTPDGKGDWGANLGPGTGIAANHDSVMMVFACVEDGNITGLQRVDFEGNILRRYFSFYPWDQRTSAAMDDKQIYVAIYYNEKLELAVYNMDEPRGKILAVLPVKPTATLHGRWRNRPVAYAEGMALSDSTVYVSVPHANALCLVGRADGKVTKIDMPTPRGLAFRNGKLFAVSGKKLLRLSPDGAVEATIVDGGGLKNPSSLTVDPQGNFYIGDSGADIYREGTLVGGTRKADAGTRQIHVFGPDGKPLRRIGAAGGSPLEGRFNADGLGDISGIAVDPAGRVWVNDVATGFKRNSVWSPDGKLLKQWFCRKIQHTSDVVNPANPRELLSIRDSFDDSPPGIYAYEVDFTSGTWKPSWFYELTVERSYAPAQGAYHSFTHGGFPMEKAYPEKKGRWPVFSYSDSLAAVDGRLYMLQSSGNGEGAIYLVTPDAPPKPVAVIGYHHLAEKNAAGEWLATYDQNGPNRWMNWADRNGDGAMQSDEMTITESNPKLAPFRRVSSGVLRSDGSVSLSMLSKDGAIRARLAPRKWLPNGAPVFDWSDLETFAPDQVPDFRGGDGVKTPGAISFLGSITKDGARYAILDPSTPSGLRLPGIDGEGWWASRNWRKKLAAWDADGTLKWAVGRRAPGRAGPGQMYNPMRLSGIARDCLFVSDALAMTWVWHKDGFYVGRLFHDTGDNAMDDLGVYVELMGNGIHEANGKLYTLVNDTACAVHEVNLPAFTPITAAKVRLSPADTTRAKPWDPDGVPPTEKPAYIALPTPANNTPGAYKVKVDGNLDGREGWDGVNGVRRPAMLVLLDGQSLASVRVMYDAENLYLGYRVSHPAGPVNSGSELPYSPFVSGAYVDFSIAPDWSQPQRREVREGDVRVLLARVRNGAAAESDFHQGFWQKKTGGANARTITSPAASVHFDQIGAVPGLQVAYKVNPKKDERTGNISFTVEVAVPLASLGLKDVAGKTIGFDVSVGTANAAGDTRERAAHWAGLSEGRVVDRPGSAELLPHTWGTLTFAPAAK